MGGHWRASALGIAMASLMAAGVPATAASRTAISANGQSIVVEGGSTFVSGSTGNYRIEVDGNLIQIEGDTISINGEQHALPDFTEMHVDVHDGTVTITLDGEVAIAADGLDL